MLLCVDAAQQLHGVLQDVVQHREPVAHAARAARQIHDQRAAAYACNAPQARSSFAIFADLDWEIGIDFEGSNIITPIKQQPSST